MKIQVKADRQEILDGMHEGVIVDVQYRDKPYEYTDIIVEFGDIRLKAGYPTQVAPSSKLGKLLTRFDVVLEVGAELDVGDCLIGKHCDFLTITEETAKGNFAKVMPESVKPHGAKKK